MAKGRKKSPGRKKAPIEPEPIRKPRRKPLWPWIILGLVIVAIALIAVAGFWGTSPPSTGNCLKLCYQRDMYDGASGIPFDDAVSWTTLQNERRIGIAYPPASQVAFFITPPAFGRLEYSIGFAMTAFRDADKIDVVVTFTSSDGRQVELERRSFDPKRAEVTGIWHERRKDLPEGLGSGRIAFEVRGISPDAAEGTAFIANPRIINHDNRRRTRVIMIGVDTLRADHLGCYGYSRDTSPTIDKLASEGTLFEQCISTSPWTFTSFGSMFTGKYPSASGATTVNKFLRNEEDTFAEAMSRNGFLTCAVTNNVWFSPSFNLLQGFDNHRDFDNVAGMSLDYAQNWLMNNRDVDCLLFVHLIDPHLPYSPPGDYAHKFDPDYRGPYETFFNGIEDYRAGKLEITPKLNEHLIDLYDGEIAYMDNALGEFLNSLETNRLMDGATIILAADHGEEFLDHGSFEHGHSMYNELLHVPLIIKGPGYKAGRRFDGLVSPMDIYATLAGAYGVANFETSPDVNAQENSGGVSALDLREVLRGRIGGERSIYSEQIYYGEEMSALTDLEYKYIYHADDGSEELYDRTVDPREKSDIAADRRAVVRERRMFIQNFIASYQSGFHVRFNRKHQPFAHHFVGTISCDAGILSTTRDRLDNGDRFDVDSVSIRFDINLPEDMEKGFTFKAADPSADIVFDITVDDQPGDTSLIHIGPAKEIPEGNPFILTMNDSRFSLGQPVMLRATDPGVYIWAINPDLVESPWQNLSSEEEEQLRNLGYLSG